MLFRQLLNDETACASYLLGCKSKSRLAVVDPHIDLVEEYIALAEAHRIPIVAVLETHLQADHVSVTLAAGNGHARRGENPRGDRASGPAALPRRRQGPRRTRSVAGILT